MNNEFEATAKLLKKAKKNDPLLNFVLSVVETTIRNFFLKVMEHDNKGKIPSSEVLETMVNTMLEITFDLNERKNRELKKEIH